MTEDAKTAARQAQVARMEMVGLARMTTERLTNTVDHLLKPLDSDWVVSPSAVEPVLRQLRTVDRLARVLEEMAIDFATDAHRDHNEPREQP